MSTPDARLNAAERAALADLEAAAAADDPSLAARLRGHTSWPGRPLIRSARTQLRRAWVRALGLGWWGIPILVAGLLLMLIGLSAGVALSVVGAGVAGLGLRLLAHMIISRRRPG